MTTPPLKSQKSSKDKNPGKAVKNDFRFAPKPVTDDMLKQTYFNSRYL
jgi:hypothetical protein